MEYFNVSNTSYMFSHCNSLISLPDISKWNISNVKDMSYMFRECYSLISFPDISKWMDLYYFFYILLENF